MSILRGAKTKFPIINIFWGLFTFFIVYGALIPFNFTISRELIQLNVSNIVWLPFVDNDGTRASIPDMVQNILFFAPFGFLGFCALRQSSSRRLLSVLGLGVLLSLSVEMLQLYTMQRTTSMTDLVTNAIGALGGAIGAFVLLPVIVRLMEAPAFHDQIANRYVYSLIIALIIVTLGALEPFDVTLDVGSIWSKAKAIYRDPIQFDLILRDEGIVGFRFFLFAYVCVGWFRESRHRFATVSGIVLSCGGGHRSRRVSAYSCITHAHDTRCGYRDRWQCVRRTVRPPGAYHACFNLCWMLSHCTNHCRHGSDVDAEPFPFSQRVSHDELASLSRLL